MTTSGRLPDYRPGAYDRLAAERDELLARVEALQRELDDSQYWADEGLRRRLEAAEQALAELWRVTIENRVVSNKLRAAVHAIVLPRAALAGREETIR